MVLDVTPETRDSLVDDVCTLLRSVLFAPDVASAIDAKARLANRYIGELATRLECTEPDSAWHFKGDHGKPRTRSRVRAHQTPTHTPYLRCTTHLAPTAHFLLRARTFLSRIS